VDIGAVADFPEGRFEIVEAQRREIGVVRWNGRFFAIRNICPHLGAPLCAGGVMPLVTEDPETPWQLAVDRERVLVVCPWHRWEFDASTGRALVGGLRVKSYPVRVEDARVLVEIET
jgi:nitrite reductase/ring-hydroxylating ferredoxin subunit